MLSIPLEENKIKQNSADQAPFLHGAYGLSERGTQEKQSGVTATAQPTQAPCPGASDLQSMPEQVFCLSGVKKTSLDENQGAQYCVWVGQVQSCSLRTMVPHLLLKSSTVSAELSVLGAGDGDCAESKGRQMLVKEQETVLLSWEALCPRPMEGS